MENKWLLTGRNNLVKMRLELWLSEAEIAIVDRGIAAFDRLAAEFEFDDSSVEALTHHQANRSNGSNRREKI